MTISYADLLEDTKRQRIKHVQDIDNLIKSLDTSSTMSHSLLLNGTKNVNTAESIEKYNNQYKETDNLFNTYKNNAYSKLQIPKPSLLNYANFDNNDYTIYDDVAKELVDEYDYKMGIKEKKLSQNEFDIQTMINQFVENGDCSMIVKFFQTRMYIVLEWNKDDVNILIWTYELYSIIIQLVNVDVNEIIPAKYIKMLMNLYNKIDIRMEERINLIKMNIKFFVKALKIIENNERALILNRILHNDILETDIQMLIDFVENFYYTLKPNETKKSSAQTFLEGALYYIDGYGQDFKPGTSLLESGGFVKQVQLPQHLTEFHPFLKCSVSKTEINNTANSLRRLNCGHLFGQKAINDWFSMEHSGSFDYTLINSNQPDITCPYCQKHTKLSDIKPATFVHLNLFVLENLYDYLKA